MVALVHATRQISSEQQLANGIQFALANMAQSLAAQLISAISGELRQHASSAAIGRTVTRVLPEFLEKEFIRELLRDEAAARQRRAMLVHLLTAADVQGFVANPAGTLVAAPTDDEDDDELTSEEAAKLLRVSRTHINTLMDTGKLGEVSRTAGGHRRISRTAVLAYKTKSKKRQTRGLDAMADASQRLGLYADERAGIPHRAKP